MKRIIQHFCLWMAILLPITTHAELTGEIIMRHPSLGFNELRITTIEDPRVSRNIYLQEREIGALSVQKNGDKFVTTMSSQGFRMDIFVYDRSKKIINNLTDGRFQIIYDISMSVKGDVVFTNMLTFDPDAIGLYFISSKELTRQRPRIERLDKVEAFSVDFSPDGKKVVFDNHDSIFIKDLQSGKLTRLTQKGYLPTFHPNRRQLAYANSSVRRATMLGIISLGNSDYKKLFFLEDHFRFLDLKWSPDGKYLIYTVENLDRQSHSVYSIKVEDGTQEKILHEFGGHYILYDWTEAVLPVDPAGLITTTWGDIKGK